MSRFSEKRSRVRPGIGFLLSACIFTGLCFTNAFAQNSLSIAAQNPEPGDVSLYKFEFTLPEALPATAALVLTLPDNFALSGTAIAASSTILGGFSVSVRDNDIWMVRKGEGPAVSAGRKVDLLLSSIKNASDQGSFPLALRIFADGPGALQNSAANTGNIADKASLRGTVNLLRTQ